jgi:hypothetical protein
MALAFINEMGQRGREALRQFESTGDKAYLIRADLLFRECAGFSGEMENAALEFPNNIDPYVWGIAREHLWPKWLDQFLETGDIFPDDATMASQIAAAIKRAKEEEMEDYLE